MKYMILSLVFLTGCQSVLADKPKCLESKKVLVDLPELTICQKTYDNGSSYGYCIQWAKYPPQTIEETKCVKWSSQ